MPRGDWVRNWRKNTKDRMIAAMGGRCAICGYRRCPSALEFHHIDPKEKDFTFGAVTANPRGWSDIVAELRKCVLLCCRCHREVHAGFIGVPKQYPSFNDEYAQYGHKKGPHITICPVCGANKSPKRKFCSISCSSSRDKTDWSGIDVVELSKTITNIEIANMAGVSETAVRKRIKKLLSSSMVEHRAVNAVVTGSSPV